MTIKERKLELRLSPMSTLTLILPLEDEARLETSDTMVEGAAAEAYIVGVQGARQSAKKVLSSHLTSCNQFPFQNSWYT